MVNDLEAHGFVVPLTQLPEYFVAEDIGWNQLHKTQDKEEVPEDDEVEYIHDGGDSELEDWDMYMQADDGLVKIADNESNMEDQHIPGLCKVEVSYTKNVEEILKELRGPLEVTADNESNMEDQHIPGLCKVEVSYTKNVEEILKELRGPLEVTYTVDPREVQQHLELWRPAIEKEVSSVEDTTGNIKALIIIYVDDILLMGEEETVRGIAETIQKEWTTSPLTFLRPGEPIRFLGTELEISQDQTAIYLNQRSYVEEIARSYDIKEGDTGKIPLTREMASFEWVEGDIEPTVEAIASAQRITGEVMWMAHKTRADVAYTSCLMASITLKAAPFRCLEIGWKVLRYLYTTREVKLAIRDDGSALTLYPDAAFAPSSGRSHTGWVVCWSGTPICWRSARQTSITLSTAESELQAIIDGSIGMLGLEAMLLDLEVEPQGKLIASDSTSALAIGAGTGSWRTRHLRLLPVPSWGSNKEDEEASPAARCYGVGN
eukprot:s703_g12.t2